MLVLARMRDESIVINGNIEVMVIDIRNGKVRLGIDAPRSITVHRKEVQDQIDEEKRNGTKPNNTDSTH